MDPIWGVCSRVPGPWPPRPGTRTVVLRSSGRIDRFKYRLMPSIYSAARENHLTGLPIARPLVFEYPDDPAVGNLSSEWMFGNSLLVSPVVANELSHILA